MSGAAQRSRVLPWTSRVLFLTTLSSAPQGVCGCCIQASLPSFTLAVLAVCPFSVNAVFVLRFGERLHFQLWAVVLQYCYLLGALTSALGPRSLQWSPADSILAIVAPHWWAVASASCSGDPFSRV